MTLSCSHKTGKMFSKNQEHHDLLRKASLEAPPVKSFFYLKKVTFLGHVISSEDIQPVAKLVIDLNNPTSPECRNDIIRVFGYLGF